MTKILLISYNPPQLVGEAKIEAAHYRTWQFLEPLLQDGHTVCLCANELESGETPELPQAWANHLLYRTIPFGKRGWVKELQQAHDIFGPDCIVAVNFSHCLYATKLRTTKPVWMDIYGDMLTIMQAACYRAKSDRGMATVIAYMRQVLQHGDMFSVCGEPQQHALVGELAMSHRLNQRTFGYEFAHVVLPGSPPPVNLENRLQAHRSFLTQFGVGADDFVVLWAGGYNTWTDVDTLFKGLEWAMSQDERVRYVSVGANTYSAPDNVYTRLQGMIADSAYRDRFHLLGWRPWVEMQHYYRESDVGINIDAMHYETIYGTRTRLVEMIAAGLPVITSLGSELSYLLEQKGAGLTFAVDDWAGLGEQILALSSDEKRVRTLARVAHQYACHTLSFYETTAPVRAWVKNPRLAPDKVVAGNKEWLRQWEYKARAWLRQLIWQVTGLDQ